MAKRHAGAAERDSNSREQQEVADLRVNNEALLCMLERERQHSQQLAQRLQQAEADALEVCMFCLLASDLCKATDEGWLAQTILCPQVSAGTNSWQ